MVVSKLSYARLYKSELCIFEIFLRNLSKHLLLNIPLFFLLILLFLFFSTLFLLRVKWLLSFTSLPKTFFLLHLEFFLRSHLLVKLLIVPCFWKCDRPIFSFIESFHLSCFCSVSFISFCIEQVYSFAVDECRANCVNVLSFEEDLDDHFQLWLIHALKTWKLHKHIVVCVVYYLIIHHFRPVLLPLHVDHHFFQRVSYPFFAFLLGYIFESGCWIPESFPCNFYPECNFARLWFVKWLPFTV